MKQVLFQGGRAIVEEVPAPQPTPGQVLVSVAWSCVSPGTELADAARMRASNVLERFRRDPARLRRALDVLRERGPRAFYTMAQERLAACTPSGYSCAGTVLEVGSGVEGISPGDRLACAGSGYANHAEIVTVPLNLVSRVPDGVSLADASTVTLGAIAMQGVRRVQGTVGERIGVIGLGFLGQLTVQLLKAAGCKVFGTDLDPTRVRQAMALGLDAAPDSDVDDVVDAAQRFSEGYGLDGVILTASTASNEPLYLAMQMARRKGRIVVVGDVGLAVRREAMYPKELDLFISTSYGPGRYDPSYEEEGLDYPYAYVRWTENRNMQAYLELIAAGKVTLAPLTTRRLCISEAAEAFRLLQEEAPRPYTVLLDYQAETESHVARRVIVKATGPTQDGTIRLAILGAGSFARSVHFSNLRRLTNLFQIDTIVTQHGHTAVAAARQVGARVAATDYREVLADPAVDAVLIATRHHLHAEMVEASLSAGKHVFVEKPLALTEEELTRLGKRVDELTTSSSGCPVVFVGFNRRYSPFMVRLRGLVAGRSTPLQLSYRMNTEPIPPESWVHGVEGGGRIIGEACHIFDVFRFLVGASAVEIQALGVLAKHADVMPTDNFTATVRYAEGSICTLLYTARGGRGLPKEALELHVDGRSFLFDDYRRLWGIGAKVDFQTRRQDKGHCDELMAFHQAIIGSLDRKALWDEAVEVTRTAFEVDRQVRGQ